MLKKVIGLTLSMVMLIGSMNCYFTVSASGEELSAYETKIKSFDPEYVMWTDKMIDEGFAEISPNQGNNGTNDKTEFQNPYGRENEFLTKWAYYEFLWTHGYPVGNGRMAATVMGGIDKEVIQINEDTVWEGSPYKDPATGEFTSGTVKDAWQFFRGANADGTPADIGSANALVGPSDFREAYAAFANKSISNMSLNVSNAETLEAVQGRYNLIAMVEKYFLGKPTRQKSYKSFVEAYLDFGQNNAGVSNYTKSLNMRNASVTVDYDYNGTHYTRETIASYPAQTIATNIKSDGAELDFNAEIHTFLENPVFEKISDNQIKITAGVKDGKKEEPGGESKIKTEARLLVDAPNSSVSVSDDNNKIIISGGNEATVYVVGATNYVDYLNLDDSKPEKDCDKYISKIQGRTYQQIKTEHEKDYKNLFDRSYITIGNDKGFDSTGIPTEERIRKNVGDKSGFEVGAGNKISDANKTGVYSTFNDGDNKIATLDFNYGKYLMIAGSRDASNGIPMSQPLNLTGKWNPSLSPSWSGKYTININTEMNYWLAQPLNLAECERPLLDVFKELAESGSVTAKEHYGIKNVRNDDNYQPGDPWVMHHNFDLWRGTQPIDNATAGLWPTGGIWLLDHAWQYYLYNNDKEYLAEFYPIMKGACEFFTQFLIVDPETGYLITAASCSPEQGSVQPGPAMDTQLVRNLYDSMLKAANILGKETEDAELLEKIRAQLPENGYLSDEQGKIAPNLIDEKGLIQEWVRGDVGFDFSSGDTWTVTNPFTGGTTGYKSHVASNNTAHRHCSHLWELYPGTHVSAYSNDENEQKIFEAYKKSVTARAEGSGQGWGVAWRIALSARALDGDTAYSRIEQLIRTRTSPNMLGQHPNFQIDCNYGLTAGMVEMLMQSHNGTIDILPALPKQWSEGKFKGFKARGNIEVGVKWRKGIPTRVSIKSIDGGEVKVRNPYIGAAVVKDADGNIVSSRFESDNTVIVFNAAAQVDYDIVGFGEGTKELTWTKNPNEAVDFLEGAKFYSDDSHIGNLKNTEKETGFAYDNCELEGLKQFSLNVKGRAGNHKVSIRLGSKDGEEIASATITKSNYGEYVKMEVTKKLTGKDKLFVVFIGDTASTEKYIADVKELIGLRQVNFVGNDPLTVYKGGEKYDGNLLFSGDYAFEVDFDKIEGVDKAYVITAFYDDDDTLVLNKRYEVLKAANRVEVTVPQEYSKYTMKVMVWSDFDKMQPVRTVKELIG